MVPLQKTQRPTDLRFGRFQRFGWALLAIFGLLLTSNQTANAFQDFDFGGFGQQTSELERMEVEGKFYQIGDTLEGYVEVTGTIGPGLHAYSMKQQPGATLPSELRFPKTEGFQFLGGFIELTDPHIVPATATTPKVLEFEDEVVWAARIKFDSKEKLKSLTSEVIYDGQVCEISGNKSCFQVNDVAGEVSFGGKKDALPAKLQAQKAGNVAPISGTKSFQAGHAVLTARLVNGNLYPGAEGVLEITADVEAPYHTYPFAAPKEEGQSATVPTRIGIVGVEGSALTLGSFKFKKAEADPPAMPHLTHGQMVNFHEGKVTWSVRFKVPQRLLDGKYVIHGLMTSQTCDENGCDPPFNLHFKVPMEVAGLAGSGASEGVFEEASINVADTLKDRKAVKKFWKSLAGGKSGSGAVAGDEEDDEEKYAESNIPTDTPDYDVKNVEAKMFGGKIEGGLLYILPIALLGGFILNFMPCVLPVIGLKVLSLVEQAGESRAKAIAVNLVYVLGILSVFWVLAALAAFASFGWGNQFSSAPFNIFMCGLVFAMALSFLDVWEITLPGFIGSGSTKLDNKDGWVGTFFKGVVTTILATPCSGPGLSTALAWCSSQPPLNTFLVFTALGVGMGLPYIVIGIFPKSVSFLPKPGPWMNTFKEVMGFVLLATVCFFLSYIRYDLVFPTICFMFTLWFVCWMIGRLDFSSTAFTWAGTWVVGLVIISAGTLACYGWDFGTEEKPSPVAKGYNVLEMQSNRVASFVDRQLEIRAKMPKESHEFKFEKFTLQALQHYTHGENAKTVFIDFTADWCLTCKALEGTVLHSSTVYPRLKSPDLVAMVADKTNKNEEISALLKSFGAGEQIPIYAIFPKGKPNNPIILDGSTISISAMTKIFDDLGIEAPPEVEKSDATQTAAK